MCYNHWIFFIIFFVCCSVFTHAEFGSTIILTWGLETYPRLQFSFFVSFSLVEGTAGKVYSRSSSCIYIGKWFITVINDVLNENSILFF